MTQEETIVYNKLNQIRGELKSQRFLEIHALGLVERVQRVDEYMKLGAQEVILEQILKEFRQCKKERKLLVK